MTVEPEQVAELLAAALGGGGAGALLTARSTRKKLGADTHKADMEAATALTAAAISLVQPLNERISVLEGELRSAYRAHAEEIQRCHAERADLERRFSRLEALVVERGVSEVQLNQLKLKLEE